MTIKVNSTYESMLPSFPLIKQLNPKMTKSRYAALLRSIVEQGGYFQLGCYDGTKLVGVTGVWLGTKLWCGRYLEVDNFVIDKSYRGRGIGRKFLKWAERHAKNEKCQMIGLDSYVTADGAHRFYFANGFKVEGFHMTKRFN
jgi:GNAT superfamily N-acetyltransferase